MAEVSKLKKSVRYTPTGSAGMLERKFCDKVAKIWRDSVPHLEKDLQDHILQDWANDLVSLNIPYDRYLELAKSFGWSTSV